MSRPGPVPDWFFRQSAVLPYRLRQGRVEILMITSRKSRRWVIPKGVVEPELDAAASAAKEALEEAGIEGKVSKRALGTYAYPKWEGTCRVEVFAMRVETVHDEWEESFRKRRWYAAAEAAKLCREKRLGKLILGFAAELQG